MSARLRTFHRVARLDRLHSTIFMPKNLLRGRFGQHAVRSQLVPATSRRIKTASSTVLHAHYCAKPIWRLALNAGLLAAPQYISARL